MNINELKEKLSGVVAELGSLVDAEGDEAEQRFKALDAEARSLRAKITRAERAAELEREMTGDPVRGGDEFDHEARHFDIGRALRIQMGQESGGREAEISQEIARRSGKAPQGIYMPCDRVMGDDTERRAMLSNGNGAPLVPTQHRDDLFIDRLRAPSIVERSGATVLRNLTGLQSIPRQTGSITAEWVNEHAAPTRSDASFDQVALSPKTLAAETEVSRRMILNSSPAIEAILQRDIRAQFGAATDRAALNGAGGIGPLGILNQPGLVLLNADAEGVRNISNTVAAMHAQADVRNVDAMRGIITTPGIMRAANAARDADERHFSIAEMFLDTPIQATNHMPRDLNGGSGEGVIFGDWSELLIGYWSGIDIVVNPYAESVASKGGVLIHAFLDTDIAIRHIEAFIACVEYESGFTYA